MTKRNRKQKWAIGAIVILPFLLWCNVWDTWLRSKVIRSDNQIIELCIKENVYCEFHVYRGDINLSVRANGYTNIKIKSYEEAKHFIESAKKF